MRLCGRASAQHDAKVSIFSFCERDLKKVALTGVARTLLLQTTSVFASLPVIDESLNKNEKAKLFALLTHLGRALMRPRWRRLAEQKAPPAMKGRRDAGEAPEGTSGRPSWPLLGTRQEVASKTAQRGAKLYARQKKKSLKL